MTRGAVLVVCALVAPAMFAQPAPASGGMLTLEQRPRLLGGPDSPLEWMQQHGVDLDLALTGYFQSMLSPSSGDNSLQPGGKLNAKVGFDFSRWGLWDGFSASAIYENKQGDSVNGFNGVLLPINTQMYEPAETSDTLSLTFTQRFGKELSLSAGKFNMVDAASNTPIVGGGQGPENTFWNLNFAAPPSGLVPAYITGFSGTWRTEPVSLTLMIYDPKDTQNVSGLSGWGQDGINTRLSATFPVKLGGLPGWQGLVGVYSTQDKTDLADLPQLVLPVPPGQNTTVETKSGSCYLGWNFQQYLWQDAADPKRGWGLFGQAFIADGNPNQYRWFFNLGVAGNPPWRAQDRFGIGVFNTAFSSDLTASLNTITGYTIDDERGIELFYNVAAVPWFRVMFDLQYIRPGVRDFHENALFVGTSAQIRF